MSLTDAKDSGKAEDMDRAMCVQRENGAQEAMRRPLVLSASQDIQYSHVRA